MTLSTLRKLHDCPSCRCEDPYEAYDGWQELQREYPGVMTVDDLRRAVREEYKREYPRKWKAATSDEAVESAVRAYEPYIRAYGQQKKGTA